MINGKGIEQRQVTELVRLESNPRTISKPDLERLVNSIRKHGFWEHRPIAVSMRTGQPVVICGNQRLKAAKKLRLKTVPVIVYDNISESEEKDIILRDNVNNGQFDFDELADENWADIDLEEIGIELPELEEETEKPTKAKNAVDDEDSEADDSDDEDPDEDKESFYRSMLSDVIYESNNNYDIPNLLLEQQAGKLELPFSAWGAETRQKKGISTYHFYVDDYRFENIWKDPTKVLLSGCKQLVEPNLSLFDTTPVAWGLQQIYKKRWISRYFQECGIKIYADLNVAQKFYEYNQMGIPEGYNAFFTRGYSERLEYLKAEHEIARRISGKDIPNLLVYGGGKDVRDYCVKNSLVYVEQLMVNKNIKKRK